MTVSKLWGWALVLGLPLVLAGCASGGILSPGRQVAGPTLSDTCQLAYNAYLRERRPVFFAADATGHSCGYAICTYPRCVRGFPGDAVRTCQRISGGAPCLVVAEGSTQSWRGPEPIFDAPPPEIRLRLSLIPVERLRRAGFSISDDRD